MSDEEKPVAETQNAPVCQHDFLAYGEDFGVRQYFCAYCGKMKIQQLTTPPAASPGKPLASQ